VGRWDLGAEALTGQCMGLILLQIRMEREVAHKYRDTSIVYCGGGSRDGCSETVPPRRDSSTGPSHEINELSLVAAPDTLLRQPSPIET